MSRFGQIRSNITHSHKACVFLMVFQKQKSHKSQGMCFKWFSKKSHTRYVFLNGFVKKSHTSHKTCVSMVSQTRFGQKINQHLKLSEAKPSLVNQQSLVYQCKCDLCDAGYVGFTRRHLHQRVDEHRHTSSIGKHFRDKHSSTPKDVTTNFTTLKKCNSKFDCLIYEVFFINELRPSLNVQCDSICAKVFK